LSKKEGESVKGRKKKGTEGDEKERKREKVRTE
jgi:hypothetical protein